MQRRGGVTFTTVQLFSTDQISVTFTRLLRTFIHPLMILIPHLDAERRALSADAWCCVGVKFTIVR